MSTDDPIIIPKQGWLKVKLHSQNKWHRRYCMIDWDKAILFIASKLDRRYRDWIKLLPNIFISDSDASNDYAIEIKVDDETHFLQAESKKEYDCWFLALKQTAYSRVAGGIFGQSLENTHKYSSDKTSLIPLIVLQCCEYLLEYGSTFVGLFRVPGKQSSIKELRDMYDRGLSVNLSSQSYTPATISSLLKIYLHTLPEPIIPLKNFDEFLEIGSRFKYNQTNDIHCLKHLIETTLPPINAALLAYLCLFLKKLTEHVQETKMDSDNLAVTFGSNLIRPSEELDLNMIKGHNFNLLPLIKALIDHSEYIFSGNGAEPSEQNNESITKSSGFSSFSSLLSSNEQSIHANSRSSSMPSIQMATYSSLDSANLSDDGKNEAVQYRSKAGPLDSQQSFTTCYEREASVDGESRTTEIKTGEKAIVIKQKHRSEIPSAYFTRSTVSSPAHRGSKKTLVNKVGKSFTNFKSSMSRALHPNFSSVENISQSNALDRSSSQTLNLVDARSNLDTNSLPDCLKNLQNEIRTLKDLIDQKENLLLSLRKTSHEERLQYEKENLQLKQSIEQLQLENAQLKARYASDN